MNIGCRAVFFIGNIKSPTTKPIPWRISDMDKHLKTNNKEVMYVRTYYIQTKWNSFQSSSPSSPSIVIVCISHSSWNSSIDCLIVLFAASMQFLRGKCVVIGTNQFPNRNMSVTEEKWSGSSDEISESSAWSTMPAVLRKKENKMDLNSIEY